MALQIGWQSLHRRGARPAGFLAAVVAAMTWSIVLNFALTGDFDLSVALEWVGILLGVVIPGIAAGFVWTRFLAAREQQLSGIFE
ncbi:hypothetical protein [Sphingosinicella terrae]|uniref:hypothetical protein n=1 Tax=Sphingosinicella terrae TaxID=2172047 RepID=UPI0013B3B1B7|nr:hypothetical protein [Sphingosinicella terrae]